ncbi:MAG: PDZ domain-containing protein [Acidobacteria bacterium]|nr:PDZ domain-containing protein [Acidobacteriota bacterium]
MSSRWNLPTLILSVMIIVVIATPAQAGHVRCTKDAADCAAAMRETYRERGWSGIEDKVKNEDSTIAIRSVLPGSPADRAGLHAGDIVVSVNGVTLSKENEARLDAIFMRSFRIGKRLSIGFMRGEEVRTVRMTLERIPDPVLASRIERHDREEHQLAAK